MDISLSPEVQRRIERTLNKGRYGSANELVLDALDALEGGDSPERTQRFDAEIREAFREIERGEFTDYSREELSRVFERARTQGLELLAKTHPHKVSDAAYPSACASAYPRDSVTERVWSARPLNRSPIRNQSPSGFGASSTTSAMTAPREPPNLKP